MKNTRPKSLRDWQEMFQRIYRKHNDQFYETPDLLLQVVEEIGQVGELLRKGADTREVAAHLPMLFGWLMAFWNRIKLPVEDAAWFKYPNICPYCFREEKCLCISEEFKYEAGVVSLNAFRRDKAKAPHSLKDWQEMFGRIYGAVNKIISREMVWFHFTEEVAEVSREWRHKNMEGVREESVDILAWLFGFASKLKVDLDELTWFTFPGECNVCHQEQCNCEYY